MTSEATIQLGPDSVEQAETGRSGAPGWVQSPHSARRLGCSSGDRGP